MNRDEWIRALAEKLSVAAPDAEQVEAILELAGTAAHATERTAAPIAAWLAGLSGRTLAEVNQIAEGIAADVS